MDSVAQRILHLHGALALAVVFLVPALECSAFVGFVFPGEIAVLLAGVLVYNHRIGLGGALVATNLGAVIGDSVGYVVGRRYGRRLLRGTIGRFVKQDHIDRAERYVRERGGKAVLVGRFSAALRVMVPGFAGMAGMHYATFAVYNVIGGVIWATGFTLLGYAAGTGWSDVASAVRRAGAVLVVTIVLAGAIVLFARWAAQHQARFRAFGARVRRLPVVATISERYRTQLLFLAGRFRPSGALGLILTVSLLWLGALGWLLGSLAQVAIAGTGAARLDRPVLNFFVRHREPWLTTAVKATTSLGSGAPIIAVVVLAGGAWWLATRRLRPLALLVASYGGAALLWRLVKTLTDRPRPPAALAVGHYAGSAFPSGHATQIIAVWGMVAALVAAALGSWRAKVGVWTAAALVSGFVGVSRLYLGAHWLTDVLAGWTLGCGWLFLLLTTVRTAAHLRQPRSARSDARNRAS